MQRKVEKAVFEDEESVSSSSSSGLVRGVSAGPSLRIAGSKARGSAQKPENYCNERSASASSHPTTRQRTSSTASTSSAELDDQDERNLAMIYDQLRSGSLRIKLIVAETSRNAMQRNLKRVISPFINMAMENPPEFGMFHIALAIGCWKIEWNNSSLCIPRAITGKSAIIAADIESIATPERLDDVREKLAEVIVRWNSTMYYQQNPPKDATNKGNCQQFIDDVLQALGLQATVKKFPKPLMNYLRVLRTQGMARMEFAMTKDFREQFGITEKKLIFKTHEQLDKFYATLLEKNPNFQYDYKYEFYMLKSFDRAFWMRLQSNNINERNQRVYTPLYNEDEEMICPFGDPHTTSILKFQVKR